MGLFDKLFKREQKQLAAPQLSKSFLQSVSNSNFLLNLDNSFEGLGVEGYLSNPYVYACIDQRASNLAAIPFKLMNGDKQIVDSFLLKMFQNVFYGNQAISQFDFFYRLSTFLDISGNAYIWADSATKPRELVLYDPSDVQVIKTNGTVVYMIGQQKIDTKKNLLIHLANFNPNDKVIGAAPSQPSGLSIDTNNAGRVYNAMLMKKHTKISGIIKGTAGSIPEDVRESFKQEFMSRYAGAQNAGSVMFMGGDLEYTESQMKPTDMDWSNAMMTSGKEIGMTFKVPNELLGIGKATYENVKEAKAYFVKQCIIPQMEKILDAFNRNLVKLFGDDLKLCVDYDNIESIKEYRIESRQKELQTGSMAAINLYNSGIISLNEARELIGFDELSYDPYEAPEEDIEEMEPEEAAQEQPENAPDQKSFKDVNLKPTQEMAEEAQKGLEWRKEFNRGGTAVGVARANQLAKRENLSPNTVKRMDSYFSRHEVDKQAEGFNEGEKGYPSAGRIAWALWGGDAGQAWARRKKEELQQDADEKSVGKFKQQRDQMIAWRNKGVKSFSRAMKKEFKSQMRQIDDLFKEYQKAPGSFDASVFLQQVDSLANNQWFDSTSDLFKKQKTKLVLDIAEDQLREFEKSFKVRRTKSISLYDEEIQSFVEKRVADKVVMITDTTKREIKDIVSQAIAEGAGIGEIADRIDFLYLEQIIPNRSETIARTEVISSSNFASQKAAKNLPIVVNKVWLPTNDDRTRESHRQMFNKPPVGLNNQFQVPKLDRDGNLTGGFESLDYPGDPDGSANNVINCRCALAYEEAEENI